MHRELEFVYLSIHDGAMVLLYMKLDKINSFVENEIMNNSPIIISVLM
jgi:hypothetical protein